jgi:hypothetical protein
MFMSAGAQTGHRFCGAYVNYFKVRNSVSDQAQRALGNQFYREFYLLLAIFMR